MVRVGRKKEDKMYLHGVFYWERKKKKIKNRRELK